MPCLLNPESIAFRLVFVVLAILVVVCSPGLSGPALGARDEQGGCILYGDGWVVSLTAPQGWTISCRDPDTNGVEVALWPINSTWKDSVSVMYVNSAAADAGETLQDFVDHAVARFKAEQPGVVVAEGKPITTADGKPGIVRTFSGDKWSNHEVVAYVDAGAARLIYVLSSRSARDFEKNQPTLVALVQSSHLMKAVLR